MFWYCRSYCNGPRCREFVRCSEGSGVCGTNKSHCPAGDGQTERLPDTCHAAEEETNSSQQPHSTSHIQSRRNSRQWERELFHSKHHSFPRSALWYWGDYNRNIVSLVWSLLNQIYRILLLDYLVPMFFKVVNFYFSPFQIFTEREILRNRFCFCKKDVNREFVNLPARSNVYLPVL